MKYKNKIPNLKSKKGGALSTPGVPPPVNNLPPPPLGGNAPPLGGNAPPLGGNVPPLGGNVPPLGGNVPPLGGNVPPLPGSNLGGPPANIGTKPINNKGNNKPNNKPNNAGNRTFKNNVKNTATKALGKAANISNLAVGKAGNMFNSGKAQVGKVYEKTVRFDTDYITKPLMIIILLAVFYGFLVLMKFLVVKFYKSRSQSRVIQEETKEAKHSHRIPGDTIVRSENENGMEFTYSFWICIMSLQYNVGEWKHIMHKGSPTSFPNRAPGVWLNPTKNSIRVYMNTFKEPLEYVDIDDIPVKKWVNIQLVLQNVNSHTEEDEDIIELKNNQVMDVYVNGHNKKSMLFDSIPKQNNGDLFLNLYGGFDGFMSRLKYYPYAIDFEETGRLVKEGPSTQPVNSGELPPYLDDSWWFDYKVTDKTA